MTATTSNTAVTFDEVSKIYGSCAALQGLTFAVEHGTIHGIIGENGAGKSTAMKLLYGMEKPTQGCITVKGEEIRFASPFDAMSRGVGMIHQHFMLAEPFSVLNNITLASRRSLRWLSEGDHSAARQRILSLSEQYGLAVDPDRRVSELSIGEKQRVEILKVLYGNAEILIMDEPTAVLTPGEVDAFYRQLQRLKSEGKTILVITHKLQEMVSFADAVTVMRRGQSVATLAKEQIHSEVLALLMLGHAPSTSSVRAQLTDTQPAEPLTPNNAPHNAQNDGENTALEIHNGGRDRFTLKIAKGEILGIAGVQGNGQQELIDTVLNPCRTRHGGFRLVLAGCDLSTADTAKMRAHGVRFIPPDRHAQAVVLGMSTHENFILGKQRAPELSRWGFLTRRGDQQSLAALRSAFHDYDVQPQTDDLSQRSLASFSGGNQQKQVVARELHRWESDAPLSLIVAAEPTRGVDLGAAAIIHSEIAKAAAQGSAVLLVSSDLDELYALSDRILVLSGHKITGEFRSEDRGPSVPPFDHEGLALAMGGISAPSSMEKGVRLP